MLSDGSPPGQLFRRAPHHPPLGQLSIMGRDSIATTISRGSEALTTLAAADIFGHRFSAFWLRSSVLRQKVRIVQSARPPLFGVFVLPSALVKSVAVGEFLWFVVFGFRFSSRIILHAGHAMAGRPPRVNFEHRRTVRLIPEEGMALDSLSIAQSLPDYRDEIKGIVPLFGGKCFDITLTNEEAATRLAAAGFDYENSIKPLRLLGQKSLHISVFISVEYPDEELFDLLESHRTLKARHARRLFFKVDGYQHIENGVRVVQFTSLARDLPRKLVTRGLEIGFRYTGQPIMCFRCSSTGHVVKDCPKARNRAPTRDPVNA